MNVKLHFLGEPFVEKNGERLLFPFRKAEIMLFYIAQEGCVSRENLKFIFWSDRDENQASNNLRNAIYQLKKKIPDHFIADKKGVYLKNISSDIDSIKELINPQKAIAKLFLEEPMKSIIFPNLPEFDEWLLTTREWIKRKIADAIRSRTTNCYENGLGEELLDSLSALLVLDPFDEDSMLELIEAYCKTGCTAKAVCLYNTFCKRMESEIGISPSDRAKNVFRKLIASLENENGGDRGHLFCGRKAEVEKILAFSAQNEGKSLIFFVHGEAGVGKTSLVSHVVKLLSAPGADIFSSRSLSVGEAYPFSSWNGILSGVEEKLDALGMTADPASISILSAIFYGFMRKQGGAIGSVFSFPGERSPLAVGKAIADLTETLYHHKKSHGAHRQIFVLEDLHWFDIQSYQLLKTFLSEIHVPVIVFLSGRPESVSSVKKILYELKPIVPSEFTLIPLSPFNVEDVARFCKLSLPKDILSYRGEEYFVKESGGMPLLLMEMFKMLNEDRLADCSVGLKGIIMSRMDELTPLQRDFMLILSVFGSEASIDDIAWVMKCDPEDILEEAEVLLRKCLLQERTDGDRVLLDFTHANVRDCVYESIPAFKREKIHTRIAEVLNSYYSPHVWNPGLSSMLCHHYMLAGLREQAIKQHLYEMELNIALNHVLFPLVRDDVLMACSVPFSDREETEEKIRRVRDMLSECGKSVVPSQERMRLETFYFEIYGGYLINWGDYHNGRILVDRALRLSKERGFDEIRIRCLEHVAHHFLQTGEGNKLLHCGREILHLAKNMGMENHIGLALRFIGMSKLIQKDFTKAETIFRRSIDFFEDLALIGERYTLNLLASRCYIGEMKQWEGKTDEAMDYFIDCIQHCSDSGLFWGQSHFHAHAADAALDMGLWDLVFEHIDTGVRLFESYRGGHCGSILYSLKAICDAKRGNAHSALASLKKADFLSAIGKGDWCAAQYMAKAWISQLLAQNHLEAEPFGDYFDKPHCFYADISCRLYEAIGADKRALLVRKNF